MSDETPLGGVRLPRDRGRTPSLGQWVAPMSRPWTVLLVAVLILWFGTALAIAGTVLVSPYLGVVLLLAAYLASGASVFAAWGDR